MLKKDNAKLPASLLAFIGLRHLESYGICSFSVSILNYMYDVVQEALLEARSCLVSYSNTGGDFENRLQSLIQHLILIRDLI
jgi:hypothetical protein